MSETTNTTEEKDQVKVLHTTESGIKVIRDDFGKSEATPWIEGWGFPLAQFDSLEQFTNHVTSLCEKQGKKNKDGSLISGDQIALDLIQTAYDAKYRMKIKNEYASDLKDKPAEAAAHYELKAEKNPDKMFTTVEDALNWIPGLREPSAKAQTTLMVNELLALVQAKGNPNDPEVLAKLLQLAQMKK